MASVGTFDKNLDFGQAGEGKIAQWLIKKGFSVLPVYEKILDTGKGPMLFMVEENVVAPDLLAFNEERVLWIEAKHKTAFAWNRTRKYG